MELKFKIVYAEKVFKEDIPNLDKKNKDTIQKAIETKLVTQPHIFGKTLRASLVGYRKLRVGDYRVLFEISNEKVIIWMIAHRKDVYAKIFRRLK